LRPVVELSQTSFSFPEIAVGDLFEMPFTVTNKNEELPINYTIERVAHFRCHPVQGKLLPLQSQEIIISFLPKQVGLLCILILTHYIDGCI
jgi:hypothetical protein